MFDGIDDVVLPAADIRPLARRYGDHVLYGKPGAASTGRHLESHGVAYRTPAARRPGSSRSTRTTGTTRRLCLRSRYGLVFDPVQR